MGGYYHVCACFGWCVVLLAPIRHVDVMRAWMFDIASRRGFCLLLIWKTCITHWNRADCLSACFFKVQKNTASWQSTDWQDYIFAALKHVNPLSSPVRNRIWTLIWGFWIKLFFGRLERSLVNIWLSHVSINFCVVKDLDLRHIVFNSILFMFLYL